MAFTKIAAAGIGSTGTITLQHVVVTGSVETPVITGAASTANVSANSLVVSGVSTLGSVVATTGTFSGNVSIAGTLTYEDVTNIDSVGLITARSGIRVNDGGVVLIGSGTSTGTASQPLQVTGGAYISGGFGLGTINPSTYKMIIYGTNNSNEIRQSDGTVTSQWYQDSNGIGYFGTVSNHPQVFRTGGTDRVTIDTSGNLLVVNATSRFIGQYEGGAVNPATANYFAGMETRLGGDRNLILVSKTGDAGGNILFQSGYTTTGTVPERMRLDVNGNLGIGTANPVKKLHVQTSFVTGSARGGSFTQTLFESNNASTSYWEFQANSSGTNDILFSKNASGSYGIVGYDHSTDALRFFANSAERARITGIGSLGVGYTDPFTGIHLNTTARDIVSGNAIKGSTMAGLTITGSQNTNASLGVWFGTNSAHWCGISGQRSNFADTWGTDLRFYTHEDATNDLTYARERMKIDSAGRVTKPYQPCFYCDLQSSGLNPGFANGAVVPFATAITNIGSNFNTTNYRFVAPIAAKYIFHVSLGFGNNSTNNVWIAGRFRKNGTVLNANHYFLGQVSQINANQYDTVGGTVILDLAANDYIDVIAEYNTFNGNLGFGSFCGFLLS